MKNWRNIESGTRRKTLAAFAVLAAISILVVGKARAQEEKTGRFAQTGQVRAVVSETETPTPAWKNTVHDAGFRFEGVARSKIDYYFRYRTSDRGAAAERWLALDGDWSRFSNQTVSLTGRVEDGRLKSASLAPLAASAAAAAPLINPPPTVGLYKTVVVPLTIEPLPAVAGVETSTAFAVPPETIRETLFNAPNSVHKFYLEASYGAFGLTGVHHPQADVVPVTIRAAISADCQQQIVTEFTPVVVERLRAAGIETTNGSVDLGLIVYNDTPDCPSYPFATRGALGSRGVPQWVWMPASWFAAGPVIVTHEIGHALGGNHPYAVRCTDYDQPSTCVAVEAVDRSFMTSAGRYQLLPNNFERRRWGWHPAGAFERPATGATGFFDLHSPAFALTVKHGARQGSFYLRPLGGAYAGWEVYPEARREWGTFERYGAADAAFRSGITVRYGHSNYADPEALSILVDPNETAGFEDAPLRAGQEVTIGGLTISCLREHNPSWGTRLAVE